jgi:hypothetical protein
MFSYSQKQILIRVLKDHKEYTKELPACFKDDEEVDELIKILKNEVEPCQKIKQQQ